jgi:hypothetical protein
MSARATAAMTLLALVLSACDRPASSPAASAPVANQTANASPAKPATAQTTSSASQDHPTLVPVTDYVLPGALAPDIGPEQLRQLFGAANVRIDDHLPGSEGEEFHGVVLYPHDNTRRAYVYFQDEKSLRGLAKVLILDRDTRWHLDTGVVMGMPLAELARLNGKPLRFSGLGWDYGGTVTDWNGGKLGSRDGDPVIRKARLDYTGDADVAADALPSGDTDLSSDDKRYPEQGRLLTVVEMAVSFPGEDDL